MPMNDGENIPDDHPDRCECVPCRNGRDVVPEFNRRRYTEQQQKDQRK